MHAGRRPPAQLFRLVWTAFGKRLQTRIRAMHAIWANSSLYHLAWPLYFENCIFFVALAHDWPFHTWPDVCVACVTMWSAIDVIGLIIWWISSFLERRPWRDTLYNSYFSFPISISFLSGKLLSISLVFGRKSCCFCFLILDIVDCFSKY